MNQTMIDQLKAKVEQDKAILAFDESLLDLAVNGWKTDQEVQDKAIADGIATVVNPIKSAVDSALTSQSA